MTEIVEKKHALLSPSGYSRWSVCPGSVEMEKPFPNGSSKYARWGTAAHELADICLTKQQDAEEWVGETFVVEDIEIPVDMAMADLVNEYVSYVYSFLDRDAGDIIMPETRVPLTHITGEVGAEGTSDVIGFRLLPSGRYRCVVVDLKSGSGVPVKAWDVRDQGKMRPVHFDPETCIVNGQLAMYGSGSVRKFEALYDIEEVQLVIIQPPLKVVDDIVMSIADLRAFEEEASLAAGRTKIGDAELVPGDKQCKFCRAKSTCPALRDEVLSTMTTKHVSTFRNLDALPSHVDWTRVDPSVKTLASEMAKRDGHNPDEQEQGGPLWTNYRPAAEDQINKERVNSLPKVLAADVVVPDDGAMLAAAMRASALVETWLKGVRAEVERRLFDGQRVPGYKIVAGKKGNRAWGDKDAALDALKGTRRKIDEITTRTVISPTVAEKLFKDEPKKWAKIAPLIVQAEGGPSVAPESDPRPEYQVVSTAESFAAVPVAETPLTVLPQGLSEKAAALLS